MIIILIIIVADASVKIVQIVTALKSSTGATLTANADASLNTQQTSQALSQSTLLSSGTVTNAISTSLRILIILAQLWTMD
jgi:hypothetical protein